MIEPIFWQPGLSLERVEKQIIQAAYKFFKENKSATAASLGISVRTLDNKFEKYSKDAVEEQEFHTQQQADKDAILAKHRGYVPGQNVYESNASPQAQKVHVRPPDETVEAPPIPERLDMPQKKLALKKEA